MNDFSGIPDHDRGPGMQTRSGGWFYLLDPRPEDVYIGDIAAHLAKINRYTGASKVPVNVAYHSVLVEHIYSWSGSVKPPVPERLAVLLHDAAEAYTNDISRPMKMALDTRAPGALEKIEYDIQDAILMKFGLLRPPHDKLKHADNVALQMERRDFMPSGSLDWPDLPDPLPWPLHPSPGWEHDEALFLETFNALWAMRA